jgi:WD40 repeat protein
MKNIFITLFLFVLCIQHTAFAMEPEPRTTQTLPLDELVSFLDKEINKKYDSNFFSVFSTQLSDEDFLNVMHIIDQHSHPTSLALINKLCRINTGCRCAVERFLLLARKNIEKVTLYTLETIQNLALPQSITLLDQLPAPIKKLVMESAYNKTSYDYDIVLTGHTDRITFFDICTATHHAATSSLDKTLRLWNLQTGKCVHILPEKDADTIFCMTFNPNGSLLATMKESKVDDNTIKIWSTKSAQLVHTVYQNKTEIRTMPHNINDIKMLIGAIRTYTQYNNNDPDARYYRTHWNNKYKTCLPRYNRDSILRVKKPGCRPLYLCKQIVKNTPDISSEKLDQLPLFQQLTEYEKNIVNKALIAKQELDAHKLLTNK